MSDGVFRDPGRVAAEAALALQAKVAAIEAELTPVEARHADLAAALEELLAGRRRAPWRAGFLLGFALTFTLPLLAALFRVAPHLFR